MKTYLSLNGEKSGPEAKQLIPTMAEKREAVSIRLLMMDSKKSLCTQVTLN